MRKGDYESPAKAQEYHQKRFAVGLSRVDLDEKALVQKLISSRTKPKSIIVDLGAGTGRFMVKFLALNPKKIYALDNSKAMLDVLEKNYKKEINKAKIQTLLSTSDKIPLASKSASLVTAFHLFKHLADISSTIGEVARIIKPQGLFIFDMLNSRSIIRFNLDSCYAMNEQELKRVLTKYHFKILETSYLNILGETIYNILGKIPGTLISNIDRTISKKTKLGTKIFIVAQKNE